MKATYAVDGVALDDPAGRWRLTSATNVPAPASRRVTVLDLPTRDGSIPHRQGLGTGTVALAVAVADKTATGGDLASVDERVSALSALLGQARKVTWTAGTNRARTTEVIEATVAEPSLRSRDVVVVAASLVVEPLWRSGGPVVSAEQPLVTGPVVFEDLVGSTGRLRDAVVRVSGPLTGLTLTDAATGTAVSRGAVLAAGQHLYVETWPYLRGWVSASASAWEQRSGAVVLDYPPDGPLQVWPSPVGDLLRRGPRLVASVQGGTSATRICIRSSRWSI